MAGQDEESSNSAATTLAHISVTLDRLAADLAASNRRQDRLSDDLEASNRRQEVHLRRTERWYDMLLGRRQSAMHGQQPPAIAALPLAVPPPDVSPKAAPPDPAPASAVLSPDLNAGPPPATSVAPLSTMDDRQPPDIAALPLVVQSPSTSIAAPSSPVHAGWPSPIIPATGPPSHTGTQPQPDLHPRAAPPSIPNDPPPATSSEPLSTVPFLWATKVAGPPQTFPPIGPTNVHGPAEDGDRPNGGSKGISIGPAALNVSFEGHRVEDNLFVVAEVRFKELNSRPTPLAAYLFTTNKSVLYKSLMGDPAARYPSKGEPGDQPQRSFSDLRLEDKPIVNGGEIDTAYLVI